MPTGANDRRLQTKARARLRALKAIGQPPCWRCGGEIDYSAPPGTPLAYDLDEFLAREHGGDPLDPANTAPCHASCNRRAGAASTNAKRRLKVGQVRLTSLDPEPRPMTSW